jgi:hypothetical protein
MATSTTPRFGLTRWSADSDTQNRAQFDASMAALEAKAAKLAQLGMRNRVINGNFRVNQRGYLSGLALPVGTYSFDRWKSTVASTALTFTAAPAGQLVTLNIGGQIAQIIERADMPAGRYLLSHAGTARARVYKSGAAAPAFATTNFVVDLDGLADIVVEFEGTSTSQRTVGEVQLEQIAADGVVADASPFERRPLGLELALCQRYFWRIVASATNPAACFAQGHGISGAEVRAFLRLPASMRVVPSVDDGVATLIVTDRVNPTITVLSVTTVDGLNSVNGIELIITCGAASITQYRPYWLSAGSSAGILDVSAEFA